MEKTLEILSKKEASKIMGGWNHGIKSPRDAANGGATG